MPVTAALPAFGGLEAMVSRHVVRNLSNASATWWRGGLDASAPVAGIRLIFDRETRRDFAEGAVIDAQPVARLLAADCPGIGRKCALRITPDAGEPTDRLYTVLRAEPDGTGWVQVYLTEDAL
jgi:hypothetical protein